MITMLDGTTITLNKDLETKLLSKCLSLGGFKFKFKGREITHRMIDWIKPDGEQGYQVSSLFNEAGQKPARFSLDTLGEHIKQLGIKK